MVTVKLIREETGKPEEGRRVALGFDGWSRGVTKDQWTDSRGEAHFDHDPGDGKVYLDGRTAFEGDLRGRVVVYV